MKEWIFNISITAVAVTAISLIVPNGKTGKVIKGILPFIVLLSVVKPILNFNYEQNVNEIFVPTQTEEIYQEDFLYSITRKRIACLEKNCENILNAKGITGASVNIEYDYENGSYKINLVTVNLKNSVINSDKEHIDINEIEATIKNFLAVDKGMVKIIE